MDENQDQLFASQAKTCLVIPRIETTGIFPPVQFSCISKVQMLDF